VISIPNNLHFCLYFIPSTFISRNRIFITCTLQQFGIYRFRNYFQRRYGIFWFFNESWL